MVTSLKEGYTNNSIFLPAAGYIDGTYLNEAGSSGRYWSTSLNKNSSNFARYMGFDLYNTPDHYDVVRYSGYSVRPVLP